MAKKSLIEKECRYGVDIPIVTFEKPEWINVGYFRSKKEALKFAQENFGADKNGNVNLVRPL